MSWKEEIKKEESAKDYVLNRARTGQPMADSIREFAQKFPDKVPPPEIVEASIKRAEEMDKILARLDIARERMDALNNRKNPYA
tara:strand:- start:157 stop:408 length:252 start_codon:yes stop_codon:yes gene_type:complete